MTPGTLNTILAHEKCTSSKLSVVNYAQELLLCIRYAFRYELGILEGERTSYGRYFWMNADSCAQKHKLSREIVLLSKNIVHMK